MSLAAETPLRPCEIVDLLGAGPSTGEVAFG